MPWVMRELVEIEVPVRAVEPDGAEASFVAVVAVGPGLLERLRAGGPAAEVALRETLVGWRDVLGADGQPVPWSPEARDRIWHTWWIAGPLGQAIAAAIVADRGNGSAPSPAPS